MLYTCRNKLKLSEFGLGDKVVEIGLAKISKEAAGYVAGDIVGNSQFIEPFGSLLKKQLIYTKKAENKLEGAVGWIYN